MKVVESRNNNAGCPTTGLALIIVGCKALPIIAETKHSGSEADLNLAMRRAQHQGLAEVSHIVHSIVFPGGYS